MRLSNHDLRQIDQDYLARLSPEQLLHLSEKLLDDLRNARDRLNQTSQNSSRPSGSYAPWEQNGGDQGEGRGEGEKEQEADVGKEAGPSDVADDEQPPKQSGSQRKRGKQGARPILMSPAVTHQQ